MNAKLLSALTAAFALVTALAAMDLSGIAPLIPGDADATVAAISGGLTTLLIIIRAIGDFVDDGQINNSFPPKK